MYIHDILQNSESLDPQEDWEPKNPAEWLQRDSLLQQLRETRRLQSFSEAAVVATYNSWIRLPALMRAQFWREREIAAEMLTNIDRWSQIPGFHSISVMARKPIYYDTNPNIDKAPRLVGCINIVPPEERDELNISNIEFSIRQYEVPDSIEVPSLISGTYAVSTLVPIEIFFTPIPVEFGNLLYPSSFPIASPSPPSSNTGTLICQSGDSVAGRFGTAQKPPGTLTAIVSLRTSSNPYEEALILSAGHVMGGPSYEVLSQSPVPIKKIGQVCDYKIGIDASIAELDKPWLVEPRLKSLNVLPAAPTTVCSGYAVQMHGATSGHQKGYIFQTNIIPLGNSPVGTVSLFSVSIPSGGGDSGALLVYGHGYNHPISNIYASSMDPRQLDMLTCAMLGMLTAGPNQNATPMLMPLTYFVPISEILYELRLQPWVRAIP